MGEKSAAAVVLLEKDIRGDANPSEMSGDEGRGGGQKKVSKKQIVFTVQLLVAIVGLVAGCKRFEIPTVMDMTKSRARCQEMTLTAAEQVYELAKDKNFDKTTIGVDLRALFSLEKKRCPKTAEDYKDINAQLVDMLLAIGDEVHRKVTDASEMTHNELVDHFKVRPVLPVGRRAFPLPSSCTSEPPSSQTSKPSSGQVPPGVKFVIGKAAIDTSTKRDQPGKTSKKRAAETRGDDEGDGDGVTSSYIGGYQVMSSSSNNNNNNNNKSSRVTGADASARARDALQDVMINNPAIANNKLVQKALTCLQGGSTPASSRHNSSSSSSSSSSRSRKNDGFGVEDSDDEDDVGGLFDLPGAGGDEEDPGMQCWFGPCGSMNSVHASHCRKCGRPQ